MRLGHLLGDTTYLDAARCTLPGRAPRWSATRAGHCTLLTALEDTVYAPEQIVLRGPAESMAEWRAAIEDGYAPWRVTYAIPYEASATLPEYLPRLVSSEQQARVTAFVCSNLSCSLPITSLEALQDELG